MTGHGLNTSTSSEQDIGVEASLEEFVKTAKTCTTFDTLATASSSGSEASSSSSSLSRKDKKSTRKLLKSVIPEKQVVREEEEVLVTGTERNEKKSQPSTIEQDGKVATIAGGGASSKETTLEEQSKSVAESSSTILPSIPQLSHLAKQAISGIAPAQSTSTTDKKDPQQATPSKTDSSSTPSTLNSSTASSSQTPTSPIESLLSFVQEPGFDSSEAVDVLSELALGIVHPDESTYSNHEANNKNDSDSEGDELMGKHKVKPQPIHITLSPTRQREWSKNDPTPICSNRKQIPPSSPTSPRSGTIPLASVPSMTQVSAMARMRHVRNNGTYTPSAQSSQQNRRLPPSSPTTPRIPRGDKYKVVGGVPSVDHRIGEGRNLDAIMRDRSFQSEDLEEKEDGRSRSSVGSHWDEEEDSIMGNGLGERSVDVDTADCGVGLFSQPLKDMLWGVLVGPEPPKMEEDDIYYSDSDSGSSRSSGSDYSTESDDSRRGERSRGGGRRRRGREKRSEHRVYTNSSQKYKEKNRDSSDRRGIATNSSIKGFLDEITTDGIDLKWHQPTTREGPLPRPRQARLVLTIPDSDHSIEPHLEWLLEERSPPSLKNKSRSTHRRVSLFDILSIQKATESIQLPSFPTLKNPEHSILINVKNGGVLFEAETESEAKQVIHGIRWIVARLSFNLIMGNRNVVSEMLPMLIQDDADNVNEFGNGTLSDKFMGEVTNQLVEKSVSRLMA